VNSKPIKLNRLIKSWRTFHFYQTHAQDIIKKVRQELQAEFGTGINVKDIDKLETFFVKPSDHIRPNFINEQVEFFTEFLNNNIEEIGSEEIGYKLVLKVLLWILLYYLILFIFFLY